LLDAVARLVRIAETPAESKVLAPLVIKEIIYRLLASGQGERLAHLLIASDTRRISKAIGHFDEQLKMEEIVRDPSYFNRDYKKQFGAPPQRDVTRLRNNLVLRA
jgi:hypothetical protein